MAVQTGEQRDRQRALEKLKSSCDTEGMLATTCICVCKYIPKQIHVDVTRAMFDGPPVHEHTYYTLESASTRRLELQPGRHSLTVQPHLSLGNPLVTVRPNRPSLLSYRILRCSARCQVPLHPVPTAWSQPTRTGNEWLSVVG